MSSPYRPGRLRTEFSAYERSRRRRRIMARVVVGLLSLSVLCGGAAYAVYDYTVGSIQRIDISGSLKGVPRPDKPQDALKAQNILIMGVDNRLGENSKYQDKSDPHTENLSDTTIIAHLSADGKSAVMVNVPRDSVVQIPACERSNGSMTKPRTDLINVAIELGGPACTIHALESLTGIHIDHYVQIDFSGVVKMSDALGGVPVCITNAVHDKNTGLNLPAGDVTLKGQQALQFVRARKGIGDGSDLQRITRQQGFMAAMLRKALDTADIFSAPKLISFTHALGQSLVVDKDLDVVSFALKYKNLDLDKVLFTTVPNHLAPSDSKWKGHVFWNTDEAQALFSALREDKPLPGQASGSGLIVPPSAITVDVMNGTNTNGMAHQTSVALQAAGFNVADVGNAASTGVEQTTISYSASRADSAKTLQSMIKGGAQLKEDDSLGGTLRLVLGADWKGLASGSSGSGGSSSAPSGSPAPSPSSTGDLSNIKTSNAANKSCIKT